MGNFIARSLALLTVAVVALWAAAPVEGALTREQRKELADIRKDLGKAAPLIREKKFDEAETILSDAEQRLDKVAQAAALDENDRSIAPIKKLIAGRREALTKARTASEGKPERKAAARPQEKTAAKPAAAGISFTRDVAPIFIKHCLECHAENPKGNLRLDTFAGMLAGGKNGPLLVIGNADRSLIVARLLAPAEQRMPKGAESLPREEIEKIAAWINQGAKFDGSDKTVELAKLVAGPQDAAIKDGAAKPNATKKNSGSKKESLAKKESGTNKNMEVAVARASGGETVSFKKDIAPFMVNLCLNCHGGKEPKSNFSLETFEKLMIGGKSGAVVIAGDLDKSRLWSLVGKQEPIKMPMGEVRITRDNWNNLQTWIREGAKFDGGDPRAPLRSLVPTANDTRGKELAGLSADEFHALRRKRAQELWEKTLPSSKPTILESGEFVLYGDVPQARLQEVSAWAGAEALALHTLLDGKTAASAPLFKGGLAVFVLKDRFSFNEFHIGLLDHPAPLEVSGFARVTGNQEDALLVIQDSGDAAGDNSPGLHATAVSTLAEAALRRSAAALPEWLVLGTSLALASEPDPRSEYFRRLRSLAPEAARTLKGPDDLFSARGLSPEQTAAVGYTLVGHMQKTGGEKKFQAFLRAVTGGSDVNAAISQVYGVDRGALANSYAASLSK